MKDCKCCKQLINEEEAFCPFCGYDPKTDTINESFRKKPVHVKGAKKRVAEENSGRGGVSPAVKKFAFLGVAVVIFSLIYGRNFDLKRMKNIIKNYSNKAMNEFKQKQTKSGGEVTQLIPLGFVADGATGDTAEEFKPANPIILQGVAWGGVANQALINDKTYNVGDVIEGARIIEINNKGVILVYGARSYLLPTFSSRLKLKIKKQPKKP